VSSLSDSAAAKAWLEQFGDAERPVAAALIDEILLVGADEFRRGLRQLLDQILLERRDGRPLALYAEREIQTQGARILPIFGMPNDRRVTGLGPAPVLFDPTAPQVGSEGAIATLLTSYQRLHSDDVLDHPGPDVLRGRRAGPIVIVADFIGSGMRVWEMLEAFRLVRTIRSWRSYRLVEFFVVAYTGTEKGLGFVRKHPLRPRVLTVAGCPTVEQAFRGNEGDAVRRLCLSYPPESMFPMGFGGSSSLVAFEHGIPDNAPAILHSDHGGWIPLFPNRSSLAIPAAFPASNREGVIARSNEMLRIRDAKIYLADSRGRRWIQTMLVLAAIGEGARTRELISARTRVSLRTVKETLEFTRITRWTSASGALTALGRAELKNLRRRRAKTPVLPTARKPFYYPTQLRAR
jgi:hypothetical protein